MTQLYRRRVRNLTILTDIIFINLAFMAAYFARYELQWLREVTFPEPYSAWIGQQILFTLFILGAFWRGQVWQRRRGEFWVDETARIAVATTTATALLIFFTFFIQPAIFSRLLYIWALLFTIAFISLARIGRRLLLSMLYQKGITVDKVLLVGTGEVGRNVIRTLLARPDLGYRAIGYLNDGNTENNIGSGRIPYLGTWDDLPRLLEKNPYIYSVFIALPASQHQRTLELVRRCHEAGIRPLVVPDLFELSLSRVEFNNMAGLPIFSVRDLRISRVGLIFKRAIDLTVCAILAIPLGLIVGILGLLIKLDSPGPIFFAQDRVGKDGKLFKMVKLRSMVVNADSLKAQLQEMNEAEGPIFKIRNDPRLTRMGRITRRLSLDELPQLWNVFTGDMSLVGPRPPLPDEVAEYQEWHRQRLSVTGGITGLWQVSGRSDLTFDEQCLLDIYYIENWTPSFDIRLILQTVPYALFGRGAY